MQDDKPASCVSRALTNTERNYAQVEKELLAIMFGAERYHQFTYGRRPQVTGNDIPHISCIGSKVFTKDAHEITEV